MKEEHIIKFLVLILFGFIGILFNSWMIPLIVLLFIVVATA